MLTQRIKIHGNSADEPALQIASAAILGGSVIAVPTETFYALRPIRSICRLSIRFSSSKAVRLEAIASAGGLRRSGRTDHRRYSTPILRDCRTILAGPLTLILPASKTLPRKVTGGTGTVGVRIPDLPLTRLLMQALILPLVGTSANMSGHPPCSSADQVLQQLRED
jgi:tRNA A37 threonylcarbamoyladenosine synthetase subunit TsaC/SUA5/YrdC